MVLGLVVCGGGTADGRGWAQMGPSFSVFRGMGSFTLSSRSFAEGDGRFTRGREGREGGGDLRLTTDDCWERDQACFKPTLRHCSPDTLARSKSFVKSSTPSSSAVATIKASGNRNR